MVNYIDKHIIAFVDEWGQKILPQLKSVSFNDVTEIFQKTKKSRMILDAISGGNRIYGLGFKNCRGLVKKWLKDERGRMIRQQGRGVVEINSTTITMSVVDINVPFITSDEVFLIDYKRDKPYNLEKEIMKKAMIESGFDYKKDILFVFFVDPKEIDFEINRFIDDFRYLITFDYCQAKGFLIEPDAKWRKYHASDEITRYTDELFFKGVRMEYFKKNERKEKFLKKIGLKK